MTTFRIKEGNRDFRPFDGWKIHRSGKFRKKFFSVSVVLSESCLYPPLDDDLEHDWNKLPGLSLNWPWVKKNKDAVMAVWRPDYKLGKFDVTAYANRNFDHIAGLDDDKKAEERFWFMEPGERFRYAVWRVGNNWNVRVMKKINGDWAIQQAQYKYNKRPSPLIIEIGTYFGGQDNDGNGIGGVAPQDMSMNVNTAIEKLKLL